jgi:hypothetical protein
MFERYTSAARRALLFARHKATQAGAASIGTEHLLLSSLRIRPGLFGRMLQDEQRSEMNSSVRPKHPKRMERIYPCPVQLDALCPMRPKRRISSVILRSALSIC